MVINKSRKRDVYGKAINKTSGVKKILVIYLRLSLFSITSATGGEYL